MGYFPNGTSAEIYQATYCANCRHEGDDGCPVFDAHMVYNYDALDEGNEKLKSVLDMLIPRSKDGEPYVSAKKCRMFIPFDEDHCTETPDMFGADK